MRRTHINEKPKTKRPAIVPMPQHPRAYDNKVALRVVKPDGSSKTYTFNTIAEADAFECGVQAGDTLGACVVVPGAESRGLCDDCANDNKDCPHAGQVTKCEDYKEK